MFKSISSARTLSLSTPRIQGLRAIAPTTLLVRWHDGGSAEIDLARWIASGGDILRPLSDPEIFERATISAHGAAVQWDACDLAIDATHLEMLSRGEDLS